MLSKCSIHCYCFAAYLPRSYFLSFNSDIVYYYIDEERKGKEKEALEFLYQITFYIH
jgi:hypothetical protein